MFNVFRMELSRMLKSKSFYNSLLISVIIVSAIFLGLSGSINESFNSTVSPSSIEESYQIGDGNLTLRMDDIGNVACPNNITTNYILMGGIVAVIFATIFLSGFYKDGYCKNVIGKVKHKFYFPLARIGVLSLYSLCILAVNTAAVFALAAWKIDLFEFSHMKEFAMFFVSAWLLVTANCVCGSFFTELFKSKLPMIIYTTLGSTTLSIALVLFVNDRLSHLFSKDIDVTDFVVTLYLNNFRGTLPFEASKLIHAVVLSCAAVVFYSLLNSYIVSKRDF